LADRSFIISKGVLLHHHR